jgi:DNA-directed RNA polymerase specialized sigma24 family protein
MTFFGRNDARRDPRRLAAVAETRLLGTVPEERFDRLTRVAASALNVPAAFLSIVGRDSDFYKSAVGMPEPLASERSMRGETFCHFALVSDGVLAIEDARTHPVLSQVATVRTLGVVAYLGVPLRSRSGHAIGAFCAIDTKSRRWSESDVDIMISLARVTLSEIQLTNVSLHYDPTADFQASVTPIIYALFLRILGNRDSASRLLTRFMDGFFARNDVSLPLDTRSQAVLIRAARTAALHEKEEQGLATIPLQETDHLPDSLSEMERRILSLAYFDGLKIERIAEAVKLAAPEVRRQLLAAMNKVRSGRPLRAQSESEVNPS